MVVSSQTIENTGTGDIRVGQKRLDFSGRTYVMGILNVTPDSFFDGGRYFHTSAAVSRAVELIRDGADIIDIGGESSRPGSEPVTQCDEYDRVIPVIRALTTHMSTDPSAQTLVSIDTSKPAIAEAALQNGAAIINTITGLTDPAMREVAARYQTPVILMHMQGTPRTMQINPTYIDVVEDIKAFFINQIRIAVSEGIKEENIIIDPGIGFGKTTDHNVAIIRRLSEFRSLGRPILIGPSRKSFIGDLLGLPVEERLEGTAAAAAMAIAGGARIIRVHDVKQIARDCKITDALIRHP